MLVFAVVLAWLSLVFWNAAKPLPPGVHFVSQTLRISEAEVDFVRSAPELTAIDRAEQLIVLDHSPLGAELAQHLLARKRLRPHLKIVLITDPRNAAFGGTAAQTLAALEEAGCIVARVPLNRLRDSNPLYSGFWRLAFAWWSDPFDENPAGLPAWARTRNAKSDQRQLMIADDGSGGWMAVLAPAGASAALIVRGAVAQAMIAGELKVAGWSSDDDRLPAEPAAAGRGLGSIDARFLTEGAIKSALLDAIAAAGRGDQICMAVDDLSEHAVITAVRRAAVRGALLQIALARNAVPNQAVAAELLRDGIEIRYRAAADALPLKLLLVRRRADAWLSLGSANFTRRNLDDLNLEAAVELRMPARSAAARAAGDYFAQIWAAASTDAAFADDSPAAYFRYRVAEDAGLSSF
jgi:hypothetical protein